MSRSAEGIGLYKNGVTGVCLVGLEIGADFGRRILAGMIEQPFGNPVRVGALPHLIETYGSATVS